MKQDFKEKLDELVIKLQVVGYHRYRESRGSIGDDRSKKHDGDLSTAYFTVIHLINEIFETNYGTTVDLAKYYNLPYDEIGEKPVMKNE